MLCLGLLTGAMQGAGRKLRRVMRRASLKADGGGRHSRTNNKTNMGRGAEQREQTHHAGRMLCTD